MILCAVPWSDPTIRRTTYIANRMRWNDVFPGARRHRRDGEMLQVTSKAVVIFESEGSEIQEKCTISKCAYRTYVYTYFIIVCQCPVMIFSPPSEVLRDSRAFFAAQRPAPTIATILIQPTTAIPPTKSVPFCSRHKKTRRRNSFSQSIGKTWNSN